MTATPISHPSAFIAPKDADTIRSFAAGAERAGHLLAEQLNLTYERNWFSMYVPISHGGLELSLAEGLRLQEGLAWADGSLGWTVTLCSGANWFVRFLDPELARVIFSDPKVCLAGSGRPSGVATLLADGSYEISGHWKYATGAPHATAFTANCVIQRSGTPNPVPNSTPQASLQTDGGPPSVCAFLFLAAEVSTVQDWNSMGMIATASHSFLVDHLRVPNSRCFIIDPNHARLPLPGDQSSFLAFAEATLAVNSSGMASHFLDLAAPSSESGLSPASGAPDRAERSMRILRSATDRLHAAREEFYSAVVSSPASMSIPSRRLAATSLRVVDELYPWCGLTAATAGTEINRVWRDIHTASQHGLLLC